MAAEEEEEEDGEGGGEEQNEQYVYMKSMAYHHLNCLNQSNLVRKTYLDYVL